MNNRFYFKMKHNSLSKSIFKLNIFIYGKFDKELNRVNYNLRGKYLVTFHEKTCLVTYFLQLEMNLKIYNQYTWDK